VRRALPVLLLPLPLLALASPDGHAAPAGEDGSMILLLSVLGLIAAAYLLTHFIVDRLQRWLLFVSGAEYILLGLVLSQSQVLGELSSLSSLIALAAGWIGLLYGMELDLRKMLLEGDYSTRMSVVDVLFTGGGVAVCGYLFFHMGLHLPADESALAGGVLGCTAAAGSASAVDLLIERYRSAQHGLLALLRRTAQLSDALAILAFGVLMCVFHQGETLTQTPPAISDWVLFTVLLGVGLGWLFAAFLGDDTSENSRFLALVGIIAFASGAAFFLNLSILTVNLLLGLVLINTRQGRDAHATLKNTARPLSLILLVCAGLLWDPVEPVPALLAAGGYLALRMLFKALGCFIASLGSPLRRDLFRGLMAQGHVAVAIAVSLRLFYDGQAAQLAYTAILVSVVVNELIASRLLKGLLVDAGDVRQDVAFSREVV
jgi:hypothetical protein